MERERERERQRKTRGDGGGEQSRVEANMSVTVRQRDLAALGSEGADFKESPFNLRAFTRREER